MSREDHISRVVIVDDDAFVRRIITEILSSEGLESVTAESAEKVYPLLLKFIPDLFIIDIILPGQDGFELCETLRERSDTRDVPILILSSKYNVKDRVRGLQVGADDYLVKPFHLEELVARVKALLRRVDRPIEVEKAPPIKVDTDKLRIPVRGESFASRKEAAMRLFNEKMLKEALQFFENLYQEDPKDMDVKRYIEITRTQLMKKYISTLKSKDAIPVRTSNASEDFIGLDLNSEEGFIFSRIDGQTDLKKIVAISGMKPLKAYDILYNLYQSGVIKLKETTT
ncbi:response regulator transcription factor [bacterium]|nr:response regulator transcription factor [candidate division CSSED10-310 bacterium]